MRISSSMIYDTGIRSINDQMTTLLHHQQMLSTGRRVVTPADDPVAASRALVVTEAQDINTQFATNQTNATNALNLEESQMSSLGDLLTRVRQLAVNGGDGALSPSDLKSITAELRSRFEELMGIANTTDSNGDFIFSGNMGGTKPFGGNVDGLNAAPGNDVTYAGDSGQRNLQVSPTRYLQISDSGADIFREIPNGNGGFVTDYAATNTGTGVIDGGSVLNPATWNAPVPPSATRDYSIKFWVDTNGIAGTPGKTYYDLIDKNTGNSLLTGQPPIVPGATLAGAPPAAATLAQAGLRTYHDNEAIVLSTQPGDPSGAAWTALFPSPPLATTPGAPAAFDLGSSVNITGQPASGDSFEITPSTTQSVFKTLASLIGALEGQQHSTLTGTAFVPSDPTVPFTNPVDAGGTLDLTVNGVTKTITIPPVTAPATAYNSITLANAINGAIITAFGSNVATASGVNGNIVLSAPTNGSNTAGISVAAGTSGVPLAVSDVFTTATPANSSLTRSSSALANQIGQAITNIDQAYSRVLSVRAGIGSRLNELDSLSSVNQDVNLRYQETLSNLQDVDYAKTISDLQQNQTNLDAAQKSYMKVTQLSLFQYL
jgi:flagellar hook-associated protein 3 FlgL